MGREPSGRQAAPDQTHNHGGRWINFYPHLRLRVCGNVRGVGAARVRDLFKRAKEQSPAVVFIDEIDAVGRRRGAGLSGGGNKEREQTIGDLAKLTPGFVGADLENPVNEAAILAARRNLEVIGWAEFQDALERIIAG